MAPPLFSAQVHPNRGLGFLTLGASLHAILTHLKAQPRTFPVIDVSYSSSQPIATPILLTLPANGLRLRFDGPDQRLRLIEVLDFTKSKLSYKNNEIFKPPSEDINLGQPNGPNGPAFRHVYNRLFGPAFPGEYLPPVDSNDTASGIYVLSYPGIAFSFPLQASAWSAAVDFVSLLSSSAASPATSMAIFNGSSWPDARTHLYSRAPQHPRSLALGGRGRETVPDEVELVKVHGEGRIELVRRSSPSFWIILSETTPQDLVAELGPPDAIYRKNDRRLSIHRTRNIEDGVNRRLSGMLKGGPDDSTDTDQSSSQTGTDDSDDENDPASSYKDREIASAECFYNYFHHGFDIFISNPTAPSLPSPTATRDQTSTDSRRKSPVNASSATHLTATKLLLHANIPGSYSFNRHRRSRWTLEHVPTPHYKDPLTSEMKFEDISGRLKEVWRSTYTSEEEEKSFQRGMVLNRGWGDSPGSSCELLGGWEESVGGKRPDANDSVDQDLALGNTELFGFPGLVFEVLKNGAPFCLARILTECFLYRMPRPTHSLLASWSSTLRLPKSAFPARPSAAEQAAYVQRCTDDLYAWQRRHRPAENEFILHDGPPYANGSLHVGHALNKISKDLINRWELSKGKRIRYVPGWDCHGLPIELKALQQQEGLDGKSASSARLEPSSVRKAARELASKTVEEQKNGFKGWGIMGDWNGAYQTMNKEFEMKQLGIFREMVENGLVYRRYKPVYWSPSSGTALAEAELEYYEDHKSTAAYIKFPLTKLSPTLQACSGVDAENLSAVIWTTTPWTLPANRALAVHADLEYSIIETSSYGQLLVAKTRLEDVSKQCFEDEPKIVVDSIPGSEIVNSTEYINVLQGQAAKPQRLLHADFVSADSGSGIVHCAPGHGMEDYDLCRRNDIPAFAPVDDDGKFTKEALPDDPQRLAGMEVLKGGSKAVLDYLAPYGNVLCTYSYRHKYPYDWRSKLPIILRATEQWFADVGGIKDEALRALDSVKFIPETGKTRLESFVKGRSEWCISRQRSWGVPIPALYHRETGAAILTDETVGHIMKVIEERGIDSWWTDAEDDPVWLAPSLRESSGINMYRRGKDTMDVWFDSGTSWSQVEDLANAGQPVADVYLEGTDQHRGWFQSSLLTFIAHQRGNITQPDSLPSPPFRTLVTHGFTLDHAGRKMSKSLGNVISPEQITSGTLLPPKKKKKAKGEVASDSKPVYDGMGPDALRLWAASNDYTRDVVIGQPVLKAINTSLQKFRVTMKLLLGALEDWDPRFAVPYANLTKIDKIALFQLSEVTKTVLEAYNQYEFYRAMVAVNRWVNTDLSAFYIETVKDRLYVDQPDGLSRRAAQTVLSYIFEHLQAILAPVTPLLVEESWEFSPEALKAASTPPLQRIFPQTPAEWNDSSLAVDYAWLSEANAAIKSAQEQARTAKKIGSSLQSSIVLSFPDGSSAGLELFKSYEDELETFFVVSSVSLESSSEPTIVKDAEWVYSAEFNTLDGGKGTAHVLPPRDAKCSRCWKYVAPAPAKEADDSLCKRCEDVVAKLEPALVDSSLKADAAGAAASAA
ncbi:isoleucyl-tRNA synthetase [Xylona heveae TC161]|uniref:Isoleucine--tRNA ligase, mitochondrial n=1 Tax=Xylona heveae (strain CBS 132557 / TC161) TaxID=1328760 RepID=A0A165I157_XYLHT|nr:isoleucyl-tRNA synthetase [Xylona heveae TC161]KZF24210.1 isoleucyl-tRNA synthetase [Xylona heveae TC161]